MHADDDHGDEDIVYTMDGKNRLRSGPHKLIRDSQTLMMSAKHHHIPSNLEPRVAMRFEGNVALHREVHVLRHKQRDDEHRERRRTGFGWLFPEGMHMRRVYLYPKDTN